MDEWECSQLNFRTFAAVTRHLDFQIQQQFPKENILVMFLCGADLIIRCGGMTSLGTHSIVAVGRPGYSDQVKEVVDTEKGKSLFFVTNDTEDISSTQIRNNLALGQDITHLTFPSVADYLQHNKHTLTQSNGDNLKLNPQVEK